LGIGCVLPIDSERVKLFRIDLIALKQHFLDPSTVKSLGS
jgi:hypothetical protein